MTATLHLMVGLPGSGKTTEARRIAAETGAIRFTPDDWHLALFGDDLADPDHDRRHTVIEDLIWTLANDLLRRGLDVILDFGLWSRAERDLYRERGRQAGANVVTHFLDPPLAALLERVAARNALRGDPGFQISADHLVIWSARFEPRGPDER